MSERTELGVTEKLPYEKPELIKRERLSSIAAGGGTVGLISPPGGAIVPPEDMVDPSGDNPFE